MFDLCFVVYLRLLTEFGIRGYYQNYRILEFVVIVVLNYRLLNREKAESRIGGMHLWMG